MSGWPPTIPGLRAQRRPVAGTLIVSFVVVVLVLLAPTATSAHVRGHYANAYQLFTVKVLAPLFPPAVTMAPVSFP